jgi:hypothetical protein
MTVDQLRAKVEAGHLPQVNRTHYINNHIHTTHSFSPYTPAAAVYTAWINGLATAGIMDHDTTSGAREFLEAGRLLDMPVTVGVECRVDMSRTPFVGRRINNPDQDSCAYVAMHCIPHQHIEAVDEWFAPYRAARNVRNRAMCENINKIVPDYLAIDFDRDVLPLSVSAVTERHILFALAKKITAAYKTPDEVLYCLKEVLGLEVSPRVERNIKGGFDTPEFYEYDILGVLKSSLVEKFYIDATDELPDVTDFLDMVHRFDGIAAYAYLGDVGDSVTGDKKAQKFEDDYLDSLMETLKELGFDAVTYMPTRNTEAQLDRVMELCEKYGFMQISGEDINSPRQSFVCRAYDNPKFKHLIDAAFALIEREKRLSVC